jgi:hypothetical protein
MQLYAKILVCPILYGYNTYCMKDLYVYVIHNILNKQEYSLQDIAIKFDVSITSIWKEHG